MLIRVGLASAAYLLFTQTAIAQQTAQPYAQQPYPQQQYPQQQYPQQQPYAQQPAQPYAPQPTQPYAQQPSQPAAPLPKALTLWGAVGYGGMYGVGVRFMFPVGPSLLKLSSIRDQLAVELVSCKRKSLRKWPTKIMVASCERAGQKRNWYLPRQSEPS